MIERLFYSYIIFFIYFNCAYLRLNLLGGVPGVEYLLYAVGLCLYVCACRKVVLPRFFVVVFVFFALFLSLYFSSMANVQEYVSSQQISLIGAMLMALFVFTVKFDSCQYRKMLKAFLLGIGTAVLLQLSYAYIPGSAPASVYSTIGRVQILGCNANELAILDVIAVALLLFSDIIKSKKERGFFLFLFVFSALLTGSRTGLLCMLACFFVYLMLSERKLWTKTLIFIASLMLVYFVLMFFMPDGIVDRLTTIGASSAGDEDGLSGRSLVWATALSMWKTSSPVECLIGHGVGSFLYMSPLGFDAHNVFIKVLIELGSIGLFFMLVFLIFLFYCGIHHENKGLYYSILLVLMLSFMTLSWYLYPVVILLFSFLYNFDLLTTSKDIRYA